MELVPVDPNSEVAKNLLAVQPAVRPDVAETRQLVPTNINPQLLLDKGKADQMQADVENSAKTGASLSGSPAPSRVEPLAMDKPRPMGGVSDFDIKTGKIVPATAGSASGSYGPAAMALTGPLGLVAQSALGGGTAALEGGDLKDVAIAAALPGASKLATPYVKGTLRWASKATGGGKPLLKAGEEAMASAQSIKTPMASEKAFESTGKTLQGLGENVGLTTTKEVIPEARRLAGDIGASLKNGKPFDYGKFLTRATELNEEAHRLFVAGQNKAGDQMRAIHQAMLEDLSRMGPEAADAVARYATALRSAGGWSGLKKMAVLAGLPSAASTVSALLGSAPAAIASGATGLGTAGVGLATNLATRIPGIGPKIAGALISPTGNASPVIAELLREKVNEWKR